MKSLLITGANGFVGKYLVTHLKKIFRVIQTYKSASTESRSKDCVFLDITDTRLVNQVFSEFNPDIILHLAANKNVGYCENNPEEAIRVNLHGTKNILNASARVGAFLIFMSSDYIFEGTTGNYTEQNKRIPLTIYGKTKKEAEDLIVNFGIEYCIFRSSGIYGHIRWQVPILNWASERLKKCKVIPAFTNIYSTPTCIYDVTRGIELIARKHKKGIFHIAGSQRVSRYEFLKQYAETYGFRCDLVTKDEYKYSQSSDGYKRPFDLSLNTSFTEDTLGVKFHNIKNGFEIVNKIG